MYVKSKLLYGVCVCMVCVYLYSVCVCMVCVWYGMCVCMVCVCVWYVRVYGVCVCMICVCLRDVYDIKHWSINERFNKTK